MSLIEKQRVYSYSSGGSTIREIYQATLHPTNYGHLPRTEIVGVVVLTESDKLKAVKNGLPEKLVHVPPIPPTDEENFSEWLIQTTRALKPNIMGQYGWDVLTPPPVLAELAQDGVLTTNQHPGNPVYLGGYGMNSAPRVHAARLMLVRELAPVAGPDYMYTEVVSQVVDREFDGGDVYKTGIVPIQPDDNVDKLQKRAIEEEWRVQIATLRDFEEGLAIPKPSIIDPFLEDEPQLLAAAKMMARCVYNKEGELVANPNFRRVFALGEHIRQRDINRLLSHLRPAV